MSYAKHRSAEDVASRYGGRHQEVCEQDRRLAYPEAFSYSTEPERYVVMTKQDGRYQFAQLGKVGNYESREAATKIIWRTDPNTQGCTMTEKQARGVVMRLAMGYAVMVPAKDVIAAFNRGER